MKKIFKKIGIVIFLVIFVFSAGPKKVSAQQGVGWGETYTSLPIDTMMDEAMRIFNESVAASLKKIAVRLVMDRVRALLLGQTGGSGRIIADYEDYIYGNAEKVAKGAARDFFSSINQSASKATRDIYRDIEKTAVAEIEPRMDDLLKPMVDAQIGGDRKNLFDNEKGGGINAMYLLLTNDADNMVGARLTLQRHMEELREKTRDKQRTDLIVNKGMESDKDANGLITLPGRVVADIQSFVETMELRSLVNAQKLAEVVGGTAAMMVTQILQSGINKTMQPVDNQLENINKSVRGGVTEVQRDIYKGIEFDGK